MQERPSSAVEAVPGWPIGHADCHWGCLQATGTKLTEIAKSWPQVRYEGGRWRDEEHAHHDRDVRLAQVRFFPDFFRPSTHEPAPPFLTPQRLPCEQVDELVKAAAMMIKCENESGKLDEVR